MQKETKKQITARKKSDGEGRMIFRLNMVDGMFFEEFVPPFDHQLFQPLSPQEEGSKSAERSQNRTGDDVGGEVDIYVQTGEGNQRRQN